MSLAPSSLLRTRKMMLMSFCAGGQHTHDAIRWSFVLLHALCEILNDLFRSHGVMAPVLMPFNAKHSAGA